MSTAPTLIFPRNVRYNIGFKQGREWRTEVLVGPTGRRQARKVWVRPKRRMRATVYSTTTHGIIVNAGDFGDNDPGTSSPPALLDDDMWAIQVRPFLNTVAGQYLPFWIVDPAPRSYYQGSDIPFSLGGFQVSSGWNGSGPPLPFTVPLDLPIQLPFAGSPGGLADPEPADVVNLVFRPVGGGTSLIYEATEFTLGTGGIGSSTTLDTFTPTISPAPDPGQYNLFVSVKDAHELIPAVMTSDVEEVNFNWNSWKPWAELSFDCEEYFG